MFIAMNRFKIKSGYEDDFIEMWKKRDSYLHDVPGFKTFHLLRGANDGTTTLFASHSIWESKEAFHAWTESEAFKKAHAGAKPAREMYLGPPQFEGFEAVV